MTMIQRNNFFISTFVLLQITKHKYFSKYKIFHVHSIQSEKNLREYKHDDWGLPKSITISINTLHIFFSFVARRLINL